MDANAGKQGHTAAGGITVIIAAMLFGEGFPAFHHVVVPIQHIQTVFPIKLGHHPEGIAVGGNDGAHPAVFPQLVPVSQFDIGEALVVIMLQRAEKQILIGQKIIAVVSLSPMAIAHDNKL